MPALVPDRRIGRISPETVNRSGRTAHLTPQGWFAREAGNLEPMTSPLARFGRVARDVVTALRDMAVMDDPLLCGCVDGRPCVDCSLVERDDRVLGWGADAAQLEAAG
jgi:hypothetical protein